jgi:hypothetical protein
MTIANNSGVPLLIGDLVVWWNHDGGASTGSLRLESIVISSAAGDTEIWSGNAYSTNLYLIPDDPIYIPTGSSTIVFAFKQNYQNLDTSEQIYINLATNGCQTYPINSNN